MHRAWLITALLCLLTPGPLIVAQSTVTMSPNVSSNDSAANASANDTSATVSSLASSPSSFASSSSSPATILISPSPSPSSSSSSTSQSMSLSSSSSTSPFSSPKTVEGAIFSSSVSASSSIMSSSSQAAMVGTTLGAGIGKPTGQKRTLTDVNYIPMVAAIVSGFCLLAILLLLFLSMALVYRYLGKEDSTMMLKKPKKGVDAFYDGLEPQSAQYLVSSMSLTSLGSSPSDARLESQSSPGVHYNRGLDVDYNPSGAGAVGNGHEESYRPIQIVAADVSQRPKSTTHV